MAIDNFDNNRYAVCIDSQQMVYTGSCINCIIQSHIYGVYLCTCILWKAIYIILYIKHICLCLLLC